MYCNYMYIFTKKNRIINHRMHQYSRGNAGLEQKNAADELAYWK